MKQEMKENLQNESQVAKKLIEVITLSYAIQNEKKRFAFISTLSKTTVLR